MKQFGLSLFPVGISVWIMAMLLLLMMIIPSSSTDGFKITVKAEEMITNNSNQITVAVQRATTVKELKERIKEETWGRIQPKMQTLGIKYPDYDTVTMLEDNGSMAYHGIKEGSTVLLYINFEITVKAEEMITNKNNQITVAVHDSTTVKELKKKITDKNGIEPKMQTLGIENPDDGTVTVLQDSETMADYKIEEGRVILLFENFEITLKGEAKITHKGDQITVVVYDSTTVKELKERIKEETWGRIQPIIQIMGIKNPADGTVTVLQDSDTMAYNKIEKGAVILVFVNFEITVKADEKIFNEQLPLANTITVEVNGTQKVKDFKQKIIEKMVEESKTKIGNDLKRLTLQYGPKDDFLNDEKIIYYYGINDRAIGAIVRLSIGDFQIVIREEIGNEVKTYPIWVKSEETVAILKKKIRNESGIKPEEQTLTKYEIKVESDKKFNNGSYQITVVVQGSTTVEELKERIKEKSGIEAKKQSLQKNEKGPEIEDEMTLRYYGIGNGTTIFMYKDKFKTVVKRNEKILYTFGMNRTDTVTTLKIMIRNSYGKAVEKQTLKLKKSDGSVIELEDDKELGLYGVESSLIVHLSFANLKILVQHKKGHEEKQYTVWVNEMDTVATLKQKINKFSGIEVKGQALKLKNQNGRRHCNFIVQKYEIKVKSDRMTKLLRKPTIVQMNGLDKMEDLKKKIMETLGGKAKTKYGNDPKRLTLKKAKNGNDELEDEKTIDDCLLEEDDIILFS
ncbi:hypothetical protein niasHT_004364 [Heterodera trifolii]|uniref:Ubiquitin-like domain-containing protein n=1 Tax=Heterodera trifolii TaxID=157864 RepID=A0ABD2MBB6_9BILA